MTQMTQIKKDLLRSVSSASSAVKEAGDGGPGLYDLSKPLYTRLVSVAVQCDKSASAVKEASDGRPGLYDLSKAPVATRCVSNMCLCPKCSNKIDVGAIRNQLEP